MKTLIADDDYLLAQYLQTLLSPYGEVVVVHNGREAIEAVATSIKTHDPFALICLDIFMPDLDGNAVLQAIKQLMADPLSKSTNTKILMMTGRADRSKVIQAVENGCNDVIIKPIERQVFFEKLTAMGMKIVSH